MNKPINDFLASVCSGREPGSLVSHPYNKHKYLRCGDHVTVLTCVNLEVWDQGLLNCVDPLAAGDQLIFHT